MGKLIMRKVKIKDIIKEYGDDIACLIPVYEQDYKTLSNVKYNNVLNCEIKQTRNLKQHCKFFALCQKFVDNAGIDKLLECYNIENSAFFLKRDVDELYKFLKWVILPHDFKDTPTGVVEMWSSISFENMDNISFQLFYEKSVNVMSNILDVNRFDFELSC